MPPRPNIILILVDDMGFSDLGVTGAEIKTPNLDRLASRGALLSAMYNGARCCPTRASLLTGLYPHSAGIGHMGTDLGAPSYQGFLRNDSITIAEALRAGGYRTLISGKWHVAGDFKARDVDSWRLEELDRPGPLQRGFDRFYGILDGATHFFSPDCMIDGEVHLKDLSDEFYFTDAITDKDVGMIEEATNDAKPFFLYLAHAAPHWPLHAPPEDVARYEGVYDKGWDAIRTARHEELNGSGILREAWDISPRDPDVHPWEQEPEKDWQMSKMAAYAAMVDRMDQSIGRLVTALKRLGQYDDTLILFLSDNGGCAEFLAEDGWAQYYPDVTHDGRKIEMGNVTGLRPGGALTFQSYDKPWANVSNAPFRLFKHHVHEGGISTPLIAHWPKRITTPLKAHTPCHVIDIFPTILEAAGVRYLSELGGHAIQPLQGESLLDLLTGKDWQRAQPIFFEHEGNCAIRTEGWKLVRRYGQDWELYDMDADRTELRNLAGRNTPLESKLKADFAAWEDRVGVINWDILLPRLLKAWNLKSVDG